MTTTLIRDFAIAYWKTRDASTSWRNQMRYAADHFSKFLKRPATLDDLTVDNVNEWIAEMAASRLSRHSVRSKRRVLLVLWRAAADRDLVPLLPERKIRRVKAPPLLPKAWNADEMKRLLDAAKKAKGPMRGRDVSRAGFWRAFILVAYQTGLRTGDLIRLRYDDIEPDGSITIIQQKTGFPITCHLDETAMAAVAEIPRKKDRVFVMARQDVSAYFRQIVKAAGLVGTIKTLRKTGATLCECATPGSASAFLGHRDPGIAVRHYLDPRQVQATKARPPKLT